MTGDEYQSDDGQMDCVTPPIHPDVAKTRRFSSRENLFHEDSKVFLEGKAKDNEVSREISSSHFGAC